MTQCYLLNTIKKEQTNNRRNKYFDIFVQDSQLVQFVCNDSNQQENMVRELEGKSGEKNFFLADPGNPGKTSQKRKNYCGQKGKGHDDFKELNLNSSRNQFHQFIQALVFQLLSSQ